MSRFIDFLSGALTGMLAGVVICAILAPDAWTVVPTPRPSPHAELGPGTPSMTTEPPLPSPDVAGRTGAPDPVAGPTPLVVSPSPTGTRPAATAKPRTASPPRQPLAGLATWYRGTAGEAAAGPALRAALGPGWRGRRVVVRLAPGGPGVTVRVSDFCACRDRNGLPTLIDLDVRDFQRLAPPSRGVIRVEAVW